MVLLILLSSISFHWNFFVLNTCMSPWIADGPVLLPLSNGEGEIFSRSYLVFILQLFSPCFLASMKIHVHRFTHPVCREDSTWQIYMHTVLHLANATKLLIDLTPGGGPRVDSATTTVKPEACCLNSQGIGYPQCFVNCPTNGFSSCQSSSFALFFSQFVTRALSDDCLIGASEMDHIARWGPVSHASYGKSRADGTCPQNQCGRSQRRGWWCSRRGWWCSWRGWCWLAEPAGACRPDPAALQVKPAP